MESVTRIGSAVLYASILILSVGCSAGGGGADGAAGGSGDPSEADPGSGCEAEPCGSGIDPNNGENTPETTPVPTPSGSPPVQARTISGTVGTLGIDTAAGFEVTAYAVADDGNLTHLAAVPLKADGTFTMNVIPPGSVGIQLELSEVELTLNLTSVPPTFRSYIPSFTDDVRVGINVVTESAFRRKDHIGSTDSSKTYHQALLQARAETAALVGIGDVFAAPIKPDQVESATIGSMERLGLYLAAVEQIASSAGFEQSAVTSALIRDFADGTIDARANGSVVAIGAFPLFRASYEDEMRATMKAVIRNRPEEKIGYDQIPKVVANPLSVVGSLTADQLANFEPEPSEFFDRWVEVVYAGAVADKLIFDFSAPGGADQCLGPFKLRKVNRFGNPIVNQELVAFTLSGLSGQSSAEQFFTDASCSDALSGQELELAVGQSETAEFWVVPGMVGQGFRALALNEYADQKYDYIHFYFNREYDGEPVSTNLRFVVVDNGAQFPSGVFNYIGDAVTPISKETCYAAAAYLGGGVAPFNIAISFLQNSIAGKPAAPHDLKFFSDADCSVATNSLAIDPGVGHAPFYISMPATYVRSIGFGAIAHEFILFGVVTPTAVNLQTDRFSSVQP